MIIKCPDGGAAVGLTLPPGVAVVQQQADLPVRMDNCRNIESWDNV